MPSGNTDGKPQYIPGESMVQYKKNRSIERGTQAAFTSKDTRADTGTASQKRIGEADTGEYVNEPMASASDASLLHGALAIESGTFESQPVSYHDDAQAYSQQQDYGQESAYAQDYEPQQQEHERSY